MIIYHNPSCSVCRETIGLLVEKGCTFQLREYLTDPPTQEELRELLKKLNCKAFDIIRTKEPLYKDNYEGKDLTDAEWIRILSENPVLIERPIVISGNHAVIGRPPVRVLELVHDGSKE
jgi:arsenate reductase (glutaredoxin)